MNNEQTKPQIKELSITLKDWDRYVPRKDIKIASWFRLDRDFFENEVYFDLSHAERSVFVYFLCQATKQNNAGSFILRFNHAIHFVKVNYEEIMSTINKLELIGLLESGKDVTDTLRTRYGHVTDTLRTRALRDETGRDVTKEYIDNEEIKKVDRTNEFIAEGSLALKHEPIVLPIRPDIKIGFNLNSLYEKYPLKKGDGVNGLKLCFNFIKTQETFELVSNYIDSYRKYIEYNKVEDQFVISFYNFVYKIQIDPHKKPWSEYVKKSNLSYQSLNKEGLEDVKNKAILIANDILTTTGRTSSEKRARQVLSEKAWEVLERFGGWEMLTSNLTSANMVFVRSQLGKLAEALLSQKEEHKSEELNYKQDSLSDTKFDKTEGNVKLAKEVEIDLEAMDISDEMKHLFKSFGVGSAKHSFG